MLGFACVWSGCGERRLDPPPLDWGPPDGIAQLRFDPPCLIDDGMLVCWAGGDDANLVLLARDELYPVPLPAVPLAGEVASAETHGLFTRCAALIDGRVQCWGYNDGYALGLPDPNAVIGDDPAEMGEALVPIDLGDTHALGVASAGLGHCAWFDDGRVRCWGTSIHGSLGVPDGVVIGDEPTELGASLAPIELGSDFEVVGLDGDGATLCARASSGQIKCWGSNDRGQLGIGSMLDRGADPEQMGDALPEVELESSASAIQVSVGYQHACALLDDGRVKCWGSNAERLWNSTQWEYSQAGRLGLGDTSDRADAPEEMGDNLASVDLGNDAKAVAVSTGYYHTCALLDSGDLKCWGANDDGQLGLGDDLDRGDEPGEMGEALPVVDLGSERTVVAFEAGTFDTCALLDDRSVKCFGYGVGDEPGEMGEALEPVLRASDY